MPIHSNRKNKQLHRSAMVIQNKMLEAKEYWSRNSLQFQIQDEETRRSFYRAIDEMKRFTDNIA